MDKPSHLRPFMLLPAAPGKCQDCAGVHRTDEPHNAHSLFYQYRFYDEHGRWPTWQDALAHCSPEVQAAWKAQLVERGLWKGEAAK